MILYFLWNRFYGIPVWFVLSLGFGLALVTFFLWAHNSHRRGWLEYSLRYYWREITGAERTDVAFNVTTALVAMPAALLTNSE